MLAVLLVAGLAILVAHAQTTFTHQYVWRGASACPTYLNEPDIIAVSIASASQPCRPQSCKVTVVGAVMIACRSNAWPSVGGGKTYARSMGQQGYTSYTRTDQCLNMSSFFGVTSCTKDGKNVVLRSCMDRSCSKQCSSRTIPVSDAVRCISLG